MLDGLVLYSQTQTGVLLSCCLWTAVVCTSAHFPSWLVPDVLLPSHPSTPKACRRLSVCIKWNNWVTGKWSAVIDCCSGVAVLMSHTSENHRLKGTFGFPWCLTHSRVITWVDLCVLVPLFLKHIFFILNILQIWEPKIVKMKRKRKIWQHC